MTDSNAEAMPNSNKSKSSNKVENYLGSTEASRPWKAVRTYDRETYHGATRAWRDYGPEWDDLQAIAWERGYPWPPHGTRWDDREAEQPTQRAVVFAALTDRPAETLAIASRSSSWSGVIQAVFHSEARLRAKAERTETEALMERASWPTRAEAADALKRVGP